MEGKNRSKVTLKGVGSIVVPTEQLRAAHTWLVRSVEAYRKLAC